MTVSYGHRLSPDEARLHSELEELIGLAQTSTLSIDMMRADVEKMRTSALSSLFLCYGFLLAGGLIALQIQNIKNNLAANSQLVSSDFVVVLGAFAIALSILAFIICFASFYNRRRSLLEQRQLLSGELDIHSRILSIIDDQKKRILSVHGFSAVALATLEIRVMRLQRNGAERYESSSNSIFGSIARSLSKVI